MDLSSVKTFLWLALGFLIIGSIDLIIEGFKVHRLFANSIVGRLVKILVVVFLIELYSLGIATIAFLTLSPRGTVVLLPIVLLWIISLIFAILAVKSAKNEVTKLTK